MNGEREIKRTNKQINKRFYSVKIDYFHSYIRGGQDSPKNNILNVIKIYVFSSLNVIFTDSDYTRKILSCNCWQRSSATHCYWSKSVGISVLLANDWVEVTSYVDSHWFVLTSLSFLENHVKGCA